MKMKSFPISLIILCLWMLPIKAVKAQKIDSVFMNLPERVSPLLNRQMKFEMLEYFKAEHADSVKNKLYGNSVITSRDTLNQTLSLSTSSASNMQIKLFVEPEKSYTIGIIETIYHPIESSALSFYDAQWNKLNIDFQEPLLSDWISKDLLNNRSVDLNWLKKIDEPSYLAMRFEDVSPTLEVTNNSLDVLTKEDKDLVQSLLKESSNGQLKHFFNIHTNHIKVTIKRN